MDKGGKEPDDWAKRFQRFSSLKSLQRAVTNLIVVARELKRHRDSKVQGVNPRSEVPKGPSKHRFPTVEEWDQALRVVISTTQRAAFGELLRDARTEPELPALCYGAKKSLKGSYLYHLDSFLDNYGILRI